MIWKWFRDGGSAAVPAAAALYLCGGCAEPPVPTTIAISPASAPLHSIGETVQLTATVEDQYGQAMTGTAIAWSSGDASVAGVDAAGLVTAVDNGVATVTASAGAESGTAEVTVEQRVAVILVLPEAFTLIRRGSVRASAEAEDANGHPIPAAPFAWHSDDSTVATVDEAGLVSGVGVGTASAIASSGGVEAGSDISVVVPPPVRSMELRSVPTNGGIPSGGGSWELPPDEVFTVVLTGTGNSGYDFVAWYEAGAALAADSAYAMQLAGKQRVSAHFAVNEDRGRWGPGNTYSGYQFPDTSYGSLEWIFLPAVDPPESLRDKDLLHYYAYQFALSNATGDIGGDMRGSSRTDTSRPTRGIVGERL